MNTSPEDEEPAAYDEAGAVASCTGGGVGVMGEFIVRALFLAHKLLLVSFLSFFLIKFFESEVEHKLLLRRLYHLFISQGRRGMWGRDWRGLLGHEQNKQKNRAVVLSMA